MDCFVGECAAAADDADVSLLVNAAGHDADFAFTWRNDARAVGTDEAGFPEVHDRGYANHIHHRNTFGDAHDKGKASVGSFQNGVGSVRGRHENNGSVCAGGFGGFGNGVEDGAL